MANEQTAVAVKTEGKDIPVKVNAGIRFTLLKNHFVAALQKDEKALSILLMPTDSPEEKGITVREMVEEIKGLMGAGSDDPEVRDMEQQLTDTVRSVGDEKAEGGFDPMAIEIFLQQAFLYYRSEEDESGGKVKKLEYAFSLRVDAAKMLKQMDFFSLDEISLSIWKTDRKKVTEQMKMFMIEDFLKE